MLSLVPFQKQYPKHSKREIEKLAGEYLLQAVFGDKLGYFDLKINREKKPFAENCPYQFNLSHSGDYLLLAVGDEPLGADIEKITKIPPKTLANYFTDTEQEQVEKEGKQAFFEIWTKKESYVKYTGEGIRGLSKITTYPEEISFFTTQYEDYQIAICSTKKNLPDQIEIVSY